MPITDLEIVRYNPELKNIWNEFVESSKNGTFLFNRDYMDYHSSRFEDYSLLIYRKGKLYSLLPANSKGDTLYSHQGLTYGGLIMNDKTTTQGVLDVFRELQNLLKANHFKRIVYKIVPHIYHKIPAEEDSYALFRNNAVLLARNVSSTIPLYTTVPQNKDRREAERRAKRNGLIVKESDDYISFWEILENNLKMTYGATPVHSLEEFLKLKSLFPDNIKLWASFLNEKMMAGVVCFYTDITIHAQYISASPEGKKSGGVDIIIDYLIHMYEKNSKRWLDLGTSNEDGGKILNQSLIYQKEGFGGRATCYDIYELSL